MSNEIFRGNENTQAMMCFDQHHGKNFYVRFYSEDLEMEMASIMDFYGKRPEMGVFISEKNGTYRVYAEGTYSRKNTGPWEILMHKYWSLSNQIAVDEEKEEKYYLIRFSDSFIDNEPRRLAIA